VTSRAMRQLGRGALKKTLPVPSGAPVVLGAVVQVQAPPTGRRHGKAARTTMLPERTRRPKPREGLGPTPNMLDRRGDGIRDFVGNVPVLPLTWYLVRPFAVTPRQCRRAARAVALHSFAWARGTGVPERPSALARLPTRGGGVGCGALRLHLAVGDVRTLTGVRVCPQAEVLTYWITSSAVANSVSGLVRPSALAVVRLIASSNLVDCTTGRSGGFAPLRMRPA
jgi:hypothetical protein